MSELYSALAEKFSLTRGGPLYRILTRLEHHSDQRRSVAIRALIAILLTWLPLFLLSLAQGLAYGFQVRIPFCSDFAVNVRLLVALPILILAESGINRPLGLTVLQFLKSGLVVAEELPSFEAVIGKVQRLRDRALPEAAILVLAFLPSLFVARTEILMHGISNWHLVSLQPQALSLAGKWFDIVSMPIFRFILFRWVWRIFLWTLFLWRVSKINLYLVATHTDMAAGLGFLTLGQKAFSPIVFAGGAVIAAQVGNAIAYEGQTLSSLKLPMIAYCVLAMILLVAPLLVVGPALRKVKQKALREYGALVTIHNQLFETKWIRKTVSPDDLILGNPDASSLIDLGGSFTVVQQMAILPVNKQTFIALGAAAVVPMLPVVLAVTPVDQIVRTMLKMLG
jgi:hypothetical protein